MDNLSSVRDIFARHGTSAPRRSFWRQRLAAVTVVFLLAAVGAGCSADGRESPEISTSDTASVPPEGSGERDILARLRDGGHVMYIRHPATEPGVDDPSPDLADPTTQRNLSDAGRAQARQLGQALQRLRIPVGDVFVSPYARTRDAAELAFGPGRAKETRDLTNERHPGADEQELAQALRRMLTTRPPAVQNTVLIGHGFNLETVMGFRLGEAELAVFAVDGGSQPRLIARITFDRLLALAAPTFLSAS